jgi:glucosylceramidase
LIPRPSNFVGIGGAISDASAEVSLSKPKQQEFLQAYYSSTNGIGYSLARTTIHSCDFSTASYTYIAEGWGVEDFNIDHDRQYRIPLIKQATVTVAGERCMFLHGVLLLL